DLYLAGIKLANLFRNYLNVTWTDFIETYGIIEKLEKLPEQERSEALRLLDYHIEILKKR
ncbi:hypothetical protein RO787_18750, partial [Blautia coccoides]|uniref:hypothetical protein n=1 Tax=Blautia producta TaxID=33035 RepID=UPI0028A4724E